MPGEIGTAYVKVELDPTGIRNGLARTEAETSKRFGAAGTKSGKAFSVGWKAGLGGLAIATVAFKGAIDAASALNEQQAASTQVFGKNAEAIQAWAETGANSFGLSASESLKAANAYGNMFSTVGLGEKQTAKMSQEMVKLAGDMASFHDQDPTEMLDKLRSGLAGEAEPLRRFGILLSEGALASQALSMGLVKQPKNMAAIKDAQTRVNIATQEYTDAVKEHGKGSVEAQKKMLALRGANKTLTEATKGGKVELTDAQKVQARYALIMDQSTKAHDDFKRTSDSAANRQRALRAQVDNLQASLGQALLPAFAAILGVISRVVKFFSRHEDVAKGLAIAVVTLSTALLAMAGIIKAVTIVQKAWTYATKLGTAAQKVAQTAVKIYNATLLILNATFKVVRAGAIAMWASTLGPIALILAGLAALAIGFVILWKKSETFRRIVTGVWKAIKGAAQAVIGWIKRNWLILIAALLGPLAVAVVLIVRHWDKIKETAGRAWNAVKGAAKTAIDAVVGFVRDLPGKVRQLAVDVGTAIFHGIQEGLSGIVDWFRDKIGGGITSAANAILPGNPFGRSAAGEAGAPAARVGVGATSGGGGGGLAGPVPMGQRLRGALSGLEPAPAGGALPSGRVALTITNWQKGTGYLREVAGGVVVEHETRREQGVRMGASIG